MHTSNKIIESIINKIDNFSDAISFIHDMVNRKIKARDKIDKTLISLVSSKKELQEVKDLFINENKKQSDDKAKSIKMKNLEDKKGKPNDRLLIEYYFTLDYIEKLFNSEEYYLYDSKNLSFYYIPVMKGMLNRCIRRDQNDWGFVYDCFGFKKNGKEMRQIVSVIEEIQYNINYFKIANGRYEYISKNHRKNVDKLKEMNFYEAIQSASKYILIEIINRQLQDDIKIDIEEFINREYANKGKSEEPKINYGHAFKAIKSFEDGIYIKDKLIDITPKTRKKFYKILINVARTNEELDEVREYMISDGIEINIPTVGEKSEKRYRKDANNNIEIIDNTSFEDAWRNRNEYLCKDDVDKSEIYGKLLLKATNVHQVNSLKNEMELYDVKFVKGAKYRKLVYAIRQSDSLENAISLKNMMYKMGLLVDEKVYDIITVKYRKGNNLSDIYAERDLYLNKEFKYEQLLQNIDNAKTFEECIELKNISQKEGIKLDHKIYGALLFKADNKEDVTYIIDEMSISNIKFNKQFDRRYIQIKAMKDFDDVYNEIKSMYFKGKLVEEELYNILLSKAYTHENLLLVKKEIGFRFCKDIDKFKLATDVKKFKNNNIKISIIPDENDIVTYGTGAKINLIKKLASGGEGSVYTTNTKYVAKIYKKDKITRDKLEKIKLMVSKKIDCKGICWPVDILYNSNNEFVGYLMPRAEGKEMQRLFLAKPVLLKNMPTWKKRDTVELCITILEKIEYLHKRNIILGDINPFNILIVSSKEVYFVDTDSYQIEEYPCPVGTMPFKAQELIIEDSKYKQKYKVDRHFSDYLRTFENEYFSIAVLLFMIMVPGKHPYSLQGGESMMENILNMDFAYPLGEQSNGRTPDGPWKFIWSHMPYSIKEGFYETFRKKGRFSKPEDRLDAEGWLRKMGYYLRLLDSGKYAKQDEMSEELFPTRRKRVKAKI